MEEGQCIGLGPCSRLSATAPADSSDWRCLRVLEEGVSRSHGDMGAEPDARSPDFRVPDEVKSDDGHRRRTEESSDATDASRRSKEPEGAVPAL
ncbi:hypothetical protein NDU88_001323 [Pleurodeles waltl]|uniref:Uncharacterized protein n=1 Tax=Pleurodeles waltl TaxID=8319 RepID=A0AAV7WM01_PLEWA|nr:hypothetical protein NDU88_001323 [Pleurodeles waltl]